MHLNRLRLGALAGAVLLVVGLVPYSYFFLSTAYPRQFPQVPEGGWVESLIGLNAAVGLIGGLVLLYSCGIALAIKWVYAVSDEHARRIMRGEALRQSWMKLRGDARQWRAGKRVS